MYYHFAENNGVIFHWIPGLLCAAMIICCLRFSIRCSHYYFVLYVVHVICVSMVYTCSTNKIMMQVASCLRYRWCISRFLPSWCSMVAIMYVVLGNKPRCMNVSVWWINNLINNFVIIHARAIWRFLFVFFVCESSTRLIIFFAPWASGYHGPASKYVSRVARWIFNCLCTIKPHAFTMTVKAISMYSCPRSCHPCSRAAHNCGRCENVIVWHCSFWVWHPIILGF